MKQLRIGFIGNFQVPYTTENDRKWSFEKLGHKVTPLQENEMTVQFLDSKLDDFDIIFYSHTHGWEIPGLIGFFQRCKSLGIPTVSVHLDRWAWLDRSKDVGEEATWFTEYLFMADGSPEAVELYEKHNLNWYWLKPGVVERDCYIAQADTVRFPHEIIFVGSRNYHPEYSYRPKLVDWLKETYGDRFGHYGGDGLGTVRGHELNVLYASAKVVVGDSCFGGRPRYWSDRVTETVGRGGFLLHPECEGLKIPGVVDYMQDEDFYSLKQTIEKALSDVALREEDRSKAHHWVKQHETYTNRAEEMLGVVYGQ